MELHPVPAGEGLGKAEYWLPVAGYEDCYEVSDLGRVYSHLSHRVLRPDLTKFGYLRVELRDEKKLIHRLVAAAFIGPCPPGQEVRHGPGGKADNRATNLNYGTHSENCLDMVRNGTHHWAKKTHCPPGHEYTPENTRIFQRHGGGLSRGCRECHRIKNREWARNARRRAVTT